MICGFDIMLERQVLLVSRLFSVFRLGHQQPGRLSSLDFLAQLKVIISISSLEKPMCSWLCTIFSKIYYFMIRPSSPLAVTALLRPEFVRLLHLTFLIFDHASSL